MRYRTRQIAIFILLLCISMTEASHAIAAENLSPLALPASTKEKLKKLDFIDFARDWSFFWSTQPLEAELNESLHAILALDGDAYLSETVTSDLTTGFRSYCTAHGGSVHHTGKNFYPRKLTGLSCKTTQARFNGYMKYQVKRMGDFMYADVWFVPESEYIDAEELASQEENNSYRYNWRIPNRSEIYRK